MSAYYHQEHHHAAIRANALRKPLSERGAMALPCVIWAFDATRDGKREVDSMAEVGGT